MKYMQKKGEAFPIPFDETLWDSEVYEMIESAADEPAKPKARKAKAVAPAVEATPEVEAEAPADDDDFDFNID